MPKEKLFEYIFTLNYGGLNVKRIRKNTSSSYKLSKYITKLTNHAVKETCKRSTLLYSRRYPLPSTSKEVASMLGNTPLPKHSTSTDNIPNTKHNTRGLKMRNQSFAKRVFTARCCMCGNIIADHIDNAPYYTLTRENKKTIYFCPDCKKYYKVTTDSPYKLVE